MTEKDIKKIGKKIAEKANSVNWYISKEPYKSNKLSSQAFCELKGMYNLCSEIGLNIELVWDNTNNIITAVVIDGLTFPTE